MKQSESIKNIAPALLKAQKEIGFALRNSENPFFKSGYADLAEGVKTVKDPLNNNGISFLQPVGLDNVSTVLLHESGEWVASEGTRIVAKVSNDPQALGSAITYARRYDLLAILGVATTDDDAESAVSRKTTTAQTPEDSAPVNKTQSNVDAEIEKKRAVIKKLYFVTGKLLGEAHNETPVKDFLQSTIVKRGFASFNQMKIEEIEKLIDEFQKSA